MESDLLAVLFPFNIENINASFTSAEPTQPGAYFFRSDAQPTKMTGKFVVTGTGSNAGSNTSNMTSSRTASTNTSSANTSSANIGSSCLNSSSDANLN